MAGCLPGDLSLFKARVLQILHPKKTIRSKTYKIAGLHRILTFVDLGICSAPMLDVGLCFFIHG